ncbi:PTS sugar transporter subunit IIB [Lacticaseibacillus zeae]|uniref:PTS sugar transporter subunit IIB n=1 Tax=Lacticaseibacillus zeae TaxID=57037 RepID=A0A5R8LYH1_LACZE|nr:PTS sugar transporter subunit IIB [Lacticaseibacillus zeae]TLF42441.1 PTS sugar transporter subunit IIB [Lacticaseibacillus zeae]
MKIAAVCGSGLGSSFMVEMNIQSVLKDLGVTGIETAHFDVGSATEGSADYFFVGKDLADSLNNLKNVIVLDSIIDKKELKSKVEALLKSQN